MARFTAVIISGWVGGFVIFVIGIVVLAMNSGYYGTTGAMAFGGVLMYFGGSLMGIGLFASLLQMTAGAVIEGVANALRQNLGQGAQQTSYLSSPAKAAAPASPRERVYKTTPPPTVQAPAYADQSDEAQYSRDSNGWAQRNLSSSNYEWWTEYGKPNLMLWVREGKPDFKEWIKANKR
jgi:hypothetical protein